MQGNNLISHTSPSAAAVTHMVLQGKTALHHACACGCDAVVVALAAAGADVNARAGAHNVTPPGNQPVLFQGGEGVAPGMRV